MNLNDDCLLAIFKLLNLKDQISTARACRRFHALMSKEWISAFRHFEIYACRPFTPTELAFIFTGICDTVEEMSFYYDNLDFDIMKFFRFPNLERVSIIKADYACFDNNVRKMTEMFPNLKYFRLFGGDLSGRYITNWQHLEELNVDNCKGFEFHFFQRILERLPLKSVSLSRFWDNLMWTSVDAFRKFCSLEHITLHNDNIVCLSDLSLFPNLRSLSLDYEDYDVSCRVVESVVRYKYNQVIEIAAVQCFPMALFLRNRIYPNLRTVSFQWREFSDLNKIHQVAPNIREIYMFDALVKEADFIRWIHCPQLEIISFEKCICEFHADFTLKVKDIAKHRTTPLRINFNNNVFRNISKDHDYPSELIFQDESPLVPRPTKEFSNFPNHTFKFIPTPFEERY